MYDVITLGETLVRFTPPGMRRIEQTTEFEAHVGGSEFNTAVGLSRLGLKVAWISRLTDNSLGHLIAGSVARYRIDVAHVVWTHADRVGFYFMEEGKAPRYSRIIYDRDNTAISNMKPEDLPTHLFYPAGARLLHLTGITLAIGENAAATAHRALAMAKDVDWKVSFDVNYRSKLWSPEAARAACEPFMQAADVLFIPLKDARQVYGFSDAVPPDEILAHFSRTYPQATIAMTMGADGAIGCDSRDHVPCQQPVFEAVEVGRIGGGDAFSAGFLYGYLTEESKRLPMALRWGAAVAALKYSIPGDIPIIEREEAEALVMQGDARSKLDR